MSSSLIRNPVSFILKGWSSLSGGNSNNTCTAPSTSTTRSGTSKQASVSTTTTSSRFGSFGFNSLSRKSGSKLDKTKPSSSDDFDPNRNFSSVCYHEENDNGGAINNSCDDYHDKHDNLNLLNTMEGSSSSSCNLDNIMESHDTNTNTNEYDSNNMKELIKPHKQKTQLNNFQTTETSPSALSDTSTTCGTPYQSKRTFTAGAWSSKLSQMSIAETSPVVNPKCESISQKSEQLVSFGRKPSSSTVIIQHESFKGDVTPESRDSEIDMKVVPTTPVKKGWLKQNRSKTGSSATIRNSNTKGGTTSFILPTNNEAQNVLMFKEQIKDDITQMSYSALHVLLRTQLMRCLNLSLNHFIIGKTVGTGSFGRVCVARMKTRAWIATLTSPRGGACFKLPPYAAFAEPTEVEVVTDENRWHYIKLPLVLKILYKKKLIELKQVRHVKDEKEILLSISHPFIVNFIASFQDAFRICMLMEYVNGGELFSYLRKQRKLTFPDARFYSAEIVTAFHYLHSKGIVYRDLKPENLLLDCDGHIKITDFGFAKRVPADGRTFTLCGTHEYLAPETVLRIGHGIPVDWWALGILIFEMLTGQPPFFDKTPMAIYNRILTCKIEFPGDMEHAAKAIITRLLATDPAKRLGCLKGGAVDVMLHRFFKTINWHRCFHKEIRPPALPLVKGPFDTHLFESYKESFGVSSNTEGNPDPDMCFADF